jgi:hypothetical protein
MMAAASVFICHAQPDAAFAQDLAMALETCRLSVWRDTHNLRGSDRLTPEVRWAIEQARQIIVVLGLNTGEAAWMRREIELAQEMERRRTHTYRVIPLLLPGLDHTLLGPWFNPGPPTPPIQLTVDGLGAALPALLAALGEPPPSDSAAERNPPPLAALELTFGRADASLASPWRLAARLNRRPEPASALGASMALGPLPQALDPDIPRWYLDHHPRWPTDTVRQFAQRVDALFGAWGQALYQATLAHPGMAALTTAWREFPDPCERRLTLRIDDAHPAAAALLDLPWELLRDTTGFLMQGKQPIHIQRQLAGGGEAFPPAPPPLRILTLSPRPDTEPGQPDYRRGTLPLLEALDGLGALAEVSMLTPPTLAALEKQLNDAWAAGRPFTAVHLDGRFRRDPKDGAPLFGFEASYDLHVPLCRNAHFVSVATLASLLATYCIRLVVLRGSGETARSIRPVELASTLLAARIAAVIAVHPDAPAETLRRFWTTFHEELLRGAHWPATAIAVPAWAAAASICGTGLPASCIWANTTPASCCARRWNSGAGWPAGRGSLYRGRCPPCPRPAVWGADAICCSWNGCWKTGPPFSSRVPAAAAKPRWRWSWPAGWDASAAIATSPMPTPMTLATRARCWMPWVGNYSPPANTGRSGNIRPCGRRWTICGRRCVRDRS